MAISVNFHGYIQAKEANQSVQWLKHGKKVSFVEWCPTGFKVNMMNDSPSELLEDDLSMPQNNVFMVGNNTGIIRLFSERISKKYDLMYSERAFVHWFIAEGMEEGEFDEAREDLGFLEMDYLDVLSEQTTDDDTDTEIDDDENI